MKAGKWIFPALVCYTWGKLHAQQRFAVALLSGENYSGKYFLNGSEDSMQRVTSLKTERNSQPPEVFLEDWRRFLQEHDHAPGTIKKYTQAVAHFLAWYEQEERMPLQLAALTPIALIGYRNELQHEQHKSISTINLRVSALRAWCAWLVDQGYLPLDPAARVKLVSGAVGSKREGLSRDPARNYAIVQVLVQLYRMVFACQPLYPAFS
jgi:hypothetical protein